MESSIYTMKLHEGIELDSGTCVLRVHNGWIYTLVTLVGTPLSSIFVPDDGKRDYITGQGGRSCQNCAKLQGDIDCIECNEGQKWVPRTKEEIQEPEKVTLIIPESSIRPMTQQELDIYIEYHGIDTGCYDIQLNKSNRYYTITGKRKQGNVPRDTGQAKKNLAEEQTGSATRGTKCVIGVEAPYICKTCHADDCQYATPKEG
jgi:hypothetical protein